MNDTKHYGEFYEILCAKFSSKFLFRTFHEFQFYSLSSSLNLLVRNIWNFVSYTNIIRKRFFSSHKKWCLNLLWTLKTTIEHVFFIKKLWILLGFLLVCCSLGHKTHTIHNPSNLLTIKSDRPESSPSTNWL